MQNYWQVPLALEARPYTAFRIFQFVAMPFGLQGAPASFQWLIDIVYMVYSATWEEHLGELPRCSGWMVGPVRIQQTGLTIHP